MFLVAVKESIDIALDSINKIENNEKFKELRDELFRNIVSAIHFIAVYEERIRATIENEDADFFKAFLYVNNQIKHDIDLEIFYYGVAGSAYPCFYPKRYGKPGLIWSNFTDKGSAKARGKRSHYEKHLMEKDVANTLERIKKIILNLKG